MEAATAAVKSVHLGHGVHLQAAMHARDGAVEVGLVHDDEHLTGAVFHHDAPQRDFKISTRFLKADLDLGVDHFQGEIMASGELDVFGHELIEFDDKVLARYSPCSGMVGTNPTPDPPVVKSPQFGDSQPYASHVTRIFVDEEPRLFTPVGSIVKRRMFPERPPFVFNTVSCIGAHDPAKQMGSYTDPKSSWFNVFVGYYQIDAPKPDWDRPFGYESADGKTSDVEFADLLALGKSDWNWFANWMYGVPREDAERHSDLDQPGINTSQSGPGRVGASDWHVVTVENLEFVSAYESDAPDAERLELNSLLSGVWRRCYGPPTPRQEWPQSFVPTSMATRLLMSYWENDEAFHTVMFGGSAQVGSDPAFLDAQIAAGRAVIERTYPELGFPS